MDNIQEDNICSEKPCEKVIGKRISTPSSYIKVSDLKSLYFSGEMKENNKIPLKIKELIGGLYED